MPNDTSSKAGFRYSYEEFSDHIRAMKLVHEWEYTSRFGFLGKDQSTQSHIARVVDYFSDSYADLAEALYKAERFLSICDYVARHETLFASKAMVEKDKDGSFAVEPALLRSVHHLFTAGMEPVAVQAKKVLSLARAFKKLETEFEQ